MQLDGRELQQLLCRFGRGLDRGADRRALARLLDEVQGGNAAGTEDAALLKRRADLVGEADGHVTVEALEHRADHALQAVHVERGGRDAGEQRSAGRVDAALLQGQLCLTGLHRVVNGRGAGERAVLGAQLPRDAVDHLVRDRTDQTFLGLLVGDPGEKRLGRAGRSDAAARRADAAAYHHRAEVGHLLADGLDELRPEGRQRVDVVPRLDLGRAHRGFLQVAHGAFRAPVFKPVPPDHRPHGVGRRVEGRVHVVLTALDRALERAVKLVGPEHRLIREVGHRGGQRLSIVQDRLVVRRAQRRDHLARQSRCRQSVLSRRGRGEVGVAHAGDEHGLVQGAAVSRAAFDEVAAVPVRTHLLERSALIDQRLEEHSGCVRARTRWADLRGVVPGDAV